MKEKRLYLERKEPSALGEIMPLMLKALGLAEGMNEHIILSAWDEVTDAGQYTLSKFFRKGVLYCTISSSVLRNQLFFNRIGILDALNRKVLSDPMFCKKDGDNPVKTLILK